MGACFGVPVLAGRLTPLRFAMARCQDGHAYAPTRLATLGAPSVGCSGLGTSLWRSLTYGLPTSNPQANQESLGRAAMASLPLFVGYRPHPQKRRRSHSLATARSFVGSRPHPQKRRRSHSLATARSFVGSRPHPHKRRRSHSLATARSFVGYRPHPQKSPPKINERVTPPFGRWRLLPPPRSLRGS